MRSIKIRALSLVSALLAATLLAAPPLSAHADSIDDLEAQIAANQAKLAQVQAQETLVRGQLASTQARIAQLQALIAKIDGQLGATNARLADEQNRLNTIQADEDVTTAQLLASQQSLDQHLAQFAGEVRVLDKVQQKSAFSILFTSVNFSNFLERVSALKQIADGTHQMSEQIRGERDGMAKKKAELEVQRVRQVSLVTAMAGERDRLQQQYAIEAAANSQMARLQASLGQQNDTLIGTETAVSQTIADQQKEIDNLLAFSRGRGGSILAPEYLANSWGNYYNQRDARWGNDMMGDSGYQVWEIGCLLTSVAMVNTHFANLISPGTVARNPNNFTSGGLLYNAALDVPGHPANINGRPTRAWINNYLQQGGTVIIGMYARSGGTHFVVIVAQDGADDYWINDPWNPNAMHVSYNGSSVTGPIYTAIGYL